MYYAMHINVIFIFLDNYEYGLKLMYKLNKNSNLHSEVEERGRGTIFNNIIIRTILLFTH